MTRVGSRASRVDQLVESFVLATAERTYLEQVAAAAGSLTRDARWSLLDETAETLSERPEGQGYQDLVRSLGRPTDRVSDFVEREGITVRPGLRGVWQRRTRIQRWGVAAAVVVVLVGVVTGVRYVTATPEISSFCGGVAATQVESLSAGGVDESRVTFRQDERVGVFFCPFTLTQGVEFVDITLPVPIMAAIQPVGTEVNLDRDALFVGDASHWERWRTEDVPWGGSTIIWFEMEYCNLAGRIDFDHAEVTYRYRGRTRTAAVGLNDVVSIDGESVCTDGTRALIEAESQAWQAVTSEALRTAPIDGIPFLELEHENISRDLCRYLSGPKPVLDENGQPRFDQFEPLAARAVFQVSNPDLRAVLIDGAVLGICPEHADQRDSLLSLAAQ